MKIFSENNDKIPRPLYEPKYIDILLYLKENFNPHPIVLCLINEREPTNIEALNPLRILVYIEDEILENNLRTIESYLPEILFALSIASNQGDSIRSTIQKLAEKNFPYHKPHYSQNFLQHKIIAFLEATLFADFFNQVWEGQVLSERCYTYQQEAELRYYQHYNIRPLLVHLLNNIVIKSVFHEKERRLSKQISFEVNN